MTSRHSRLETQSLIDFIGKNATYTNCWGCFQTFDTHTGGRFAEKCVKTSLSWFNSKIGDDLEKICNIQCGTFIVICFLLSNIECHFNHFPRCSHLGAMLRNNVHFQRGNVRLYGRNTFSRSYIFSAMLRKLSVSNVRKSVHMGDCINTFKICWLLSSHYL